MNSDKMSRIFIVDDHPLIRRGLRQLLETEILLEVCGEAENIADSLAGIKDCEPDLVIVDISLPDGSGLDLIKRIHAVKPTLPILVSSMHDERLLAERALRAGAMGYVSKHEAPEHLVEALLRILEGKVYVSKEMTERMLQQNYARSSDVSGQSSIETLSNRELEVFEQIGQGFSTVQIAKHLNLSAKTIETHRAHIKEKLNLTSSIELTRQALQWSTGNI
ncbi:MAG: DNA-binding NarL/FixJ family response regulator [Gammaproteobacteria bacterium]|jgi:DNA-binding NarL/FixJ family response regulator